MNYILFFVFIKKKVELAPLQLESSLCIYIMYKYLYFYILIKKNKTK